MDIWTGVLLAVTGVAGGLVNAVAGGATLITFPAMLAAGLQPVVAVASNAVAVSPGHLVAAIVERSQLPRRDRGLFVALLVSAAGGAAGALILLGTPQRVFTLLIPPLLAVSTLLFALGPRMQLWAASRGDADRRRVRNGSLLGASVYGGYFGAGLGIMLLAVLTLTGKEDVRATNALKNLLATAVIAASILIFVIQDMVRWPETAVMLCGAVIGGVMGGRLNAVLPPAVVRSAVTLVGAGMTGAYAWRYWF